MNENNEGVVEYGGKLVAYNGYNCVAPRFGIAKLLNSNRNKLFSGLWQIYLWLAKLILKLCKFLGLR